MKLQNEVQTSPKTLIINELEQTSIQCIREKLLRKKLQYTNIDKVKIVCVLHDIVAPTNFQKGFIQIRKRWSKDKFLMTLKMILDFLFADLSQHFRIYLSLHSSILFMGIGKR